jgi:hypothetical protein
MKFGRLTRVLEKKFIYGEICNFQSIPNAEIKLGR